MKNSYWVLVIALLFCLIRFTGAAGSNAALPTSQIESHPSLLATQSIVVDHTATDITAIPQSWITAAKNNLHIYYGHTSHGSQLITGMSGLVSFANGGGLGLALPQNIFAGLDVVETSPDAGYYPDWVNNTRTYLGSRNQVTGRGTAHPATNVVLWSWCGQLSSLNAADLTSHYLQPMSQLELDYPGIVFVYMTGHADGSGETGNLHLRNQQIRQYAVQNHKVLYDFYDIELYDPDGSYFGNKRVDDGANYDSDGNGTRDRNWALTWQNMHVVNKDWYASSCAHSEYLNCNQKAYAAWWLWARLAGWTEQGELAAGITASPRTALHGEKITYSVTLKNLPIPDNSTVTVTNPIPTGLGYISGTMSATSGVCDDSHLPTLTWSGVLNRASAVTITYETTVTAQTRQAIANTATIIAPGMQAIQRNEVVIIDPIFVFLPLARGQ